MEKIHDLLRLQIEEHFGGEAAVPAAARRFIAAVDAAYRRFDQEGKRAEQLRQAQKLDELALLAGGIAHDFNNLLTTILGMSEIALASLPAGEPLTDDVKEIQATGQRGADLTRQLLTFARRQMIAPKVVDFDDAALGAARALRGALGADVELACRTVSSPGKVRVDVDQLEQLIRNLAVNARDAMPKGGTLTIETSSFAADEDFARENAGAVVGDYARLTIADTGIGMSSEAKAHLFEPFFTTKEKGKGTGLGLSTCYGIVKQNNGCIAMRSELGRGTTFDVFFPRIREEQEPAPKAPPNPAAASPRGSETILLVEDDAAVRRLAARVLRRQGYEVLEVSNGEEGLSVVKGDRDKRLRLVVTDVVMPKLGGKLMADAISRVRPDVGILFTTAYTDDVMLSTGVLGTRRALLRKPFTMKDLAEKVRWILDA